MINPITAAMRSAFNVGGSPAQVKRTFIDLDPVSNSHYELAQAWTPSGAFKLRCKFSAESVTSNNAIFRLGKYLVRLQSDTQINIWGNDGVGGNAAFTVPSLGSKMHSLVVIGNTTSTSVSIELDGNPITGVGGNMPDFTGTEYWIGRYSATTFDGILANIELEDLTTPANTLTFRLDQATSNTEYPQENAFGSELVSNNAFSDTTGWYEPRSASTLSVVDNRLRTTADSTAVFGAGSQITGLTVGNVYRLVASASKSNPSSNALLRVSAAQNLGSPLINQSDNVDATFVATASTMYVGVIVTGHSGGDYVEINAGISVKQATNALLYRNIAADQRETFTQVADGWEGVQTWSNPPSNVGSQWTYDNNVSYALVGDGNFNSLSNANNSEVGLVYRITCEITNFSGTGGLKYQNSSANVFVATGDGVQNHTYTADGSGTAQFARNSPGDVVSATVVNPFIRRFLEDA